MSSAPALMPFSTKSYESVTDSIKQSPPTESKTPDHRRAKVHDSSGDLLSGRCFHLGGPQQPDNPAVRHALHTVMRLRVARTYVLSVLSRV